MSRCRLQTFIEAPRSVVWELIADVKHHPAWWPGVIEVDCDQIAQGCEYREVMARDLARRDAAYRDRAIRSARGLKHQSGQAPRSHGGGSAIQRA